MLTRWRKEREIGGFFEFPIFDCDDPKKTVLHYLENSAGRNNYIFVQDGRQAIKMVLMQIKNIRCRSCYLPAYLCHSIIQPFRELGLNISFYGHKHPLKPSFEEDVHESVVLIIDHFGTEFVSAKKIRGLLKQGNSVILDITHSILDCTRMELCHENLYYIASLRKIFPIPDGAVIFLSHNHSIDELDCSLSCMPMIDAMVLKNFYLNGLEHAEPTNTHYKYDKKLFLSLYSRHEETKNTQFIKIRKMPLISLMILSKLNLDALLEKRNQNFLTIYENAADKRIFLFFHQDIKSPFMIPLCFRDVNERDSFKKVFIKNNIYPPIHWQIEGFVPGSFRYEHELSRRILSIPIDQRYSSEDMLKIINIIKGNVQ